MTTPTAQLQSLQFELAMGLSGSLNLHDVMHGTLTTLLRRLGCGAGAVLSVGAHEMTETPTGLWPVVALPRRAERPLLDAVETSASASEVAWAVREASLQLQPVALPLEDARPLGGRGAAWCHVLGLPQFGLLVLVRHGAPLADEVLQALMPLLPRIANAGIACSDHAALRASEQRYARLVANLPEMVFDAELGADGLVLTWASPRTRDVLDLPPESLVGPVDRLRAMLTPEDGAALVAAFSGPRVPFELTVPFSPAEKGPATRWVVVGARPSEQDGDAAWSGYMRDVTVRHLVDDAAREADRRRLAAFLMAAPDAVVGIDGRGRVSHWNLGAEKMLGYPRGEILGRSVLRLLPAHVRAAWGPEPLRAMREQQSRLIERTTEIAILRADGRELSAELTLSRVDEPGDALFLAILRDVTERRRAESEQARSEAETTRFAEAMLALSRVDADRLEPFMRSVTVTVARALEVDRVSLWNDAEGAIECLDLHDRTVGGHQSGARLEAAHFAPYFEAMLSSEPIVADDAWTHPSTSCFTEPYLKPHGIRSMLDLPLCSLSAFRGVLCVESREKRLWRHTEIRFCAEVARLVVHALDRGQQRRLEARHAAILAAIGDAVIAVDLDLRVTLFNDVAARVTGWRPDEATGQPLASICALTAVDGTGSLAPPVQAVVASGSPQRSVAVSRLRRRDGELAVIASHASPVFDDGGLRGAVLTFRDVTQEHANQGELQRQNERLRSLSEAIPDRLFAMRLDGGLRPMNAAARVDVELAGLGGARTVTVDGVFPPDTARQLLAHAATAAALGDVETLEFNLGAGDDTTHHEARLAVMGSDAVTLILREITERLRSSDALRTQGEQLNTLLATTSAIIYSQEMPDFHLEFISESARDILGFTPEAIRAPGFWQASIHPEDRDRVVLGLASLFEHDRLVHEYRHLHQDGRYRWLRDEVRLVRDPHGRPLRAVGSSFDISGRKEDEARLATLLMMQELVARVSGAFLRASDGGAHAEIARALGDLGTHSRADRASIFLSRDGLISNTHEWCRDGVPPEREHLQNQLEETFEFLLAPMRGGQPLYLPDLAALPASAHDEREFLAAQGITSLLVVPLLIDSRLRGFVSLDNPHFTLLSWSEYAGTLRLFADAVAAGLRRAEDEGAMHALNAELLRRTDRQQALLELSTELARAQSRDQIFSIVEARLVSVLGVERISVAEFAPDQSTYRVRLLSEYNPTQSPSSPPIDFVNPDRPLGEAEGSTLVGTALGMAAQLGRPVTTREFAISDFSDWTHLNNARGYKQFAIIPMLGSVGTFGTLNVESHADTRLSAEEVSWIAQFGTLLGAHLSIQQARADLRALNDALEERVLRRTVELRASETRFERLFQYAPQPMLMVDPGGQVVQANAGARTVFGYEDLALVGQQASSLVPVEALATEAGEVRAEAGGDHVFEAYRADGANFQADVGVVSVEINGETYQLVGVSDVSARVEAEAALTRSLHEKETLLKEIHHRVKNNLQIISSLLMLQSDQMPTPESRLLMQESVYRVRSMALIHQQLYGVESLERIDLGEYARALTSFLQAALAPGTRIDVTTDDVLVTIETAVPIGLILNELLTNAFKYGKPTDPEAEPEVGVSVRLAGSGDEARIVIAIRDNGPGLPDDFDPELAQSLGLQLVSALTLQLRGRLDLRSDDGARLELSCPVKQD